MPTKNKKVIFYVPDDIASLLEAESARTGCPVAELCRRAVRIAAFGEGQTTKQAGHIRARKSLEDFEAAEARPTTPVLFAGPQGRETR